MNTTGAIKVTLAVRILLAIAVLYMPFIAVPAGAAPEVKLSVNLSKNGRKLTLMIAPVSSAEGCTYKVYGSFSASKLARIPTAGILIASISGQESMTMLSAQKMQPLRRVRGRRRTKAFIMAEVICSGSDTARSNTERLSLRKKKRGLRNVKQWLQLAGRSLLSTDIQLAEAFPTLRFAAPVDLQNAGDGSNRLFVVEQGGTIRVFENNNSVTSSFLFLDISDLVARSSEQGLLGLAFHPNFSQNEYFFVNYTAKGSGSTIVARYSVNSSNLNHAESASALEILRVEQPFANHNAGQLAFGSDGYLYVPLGDGGSGGDPFEHGQDRSTLLGSLLRIDIDNPSDGRNYGIPSDNPYIGLAPFREEIFAFGFRNPWRFSFDPETDALWLADVGQSNREEIDIVRRGGNYGWNTMEGTACFPPAASCSRTGLELPVHDYDRAAGSSITGGYIYHGEALPSWEGAYIYGDYVTGRIWALRLQPDGSVVNILLVNTSFNISSFGVDQDGELYLFDYTGGKIYQPVQ